MLSRTVPTGLLFVYTLLWVAACEVSTEAARPNIVFILVDDMGYGDPGCYNANSKIATPHIDSLARDGMRFLDAHASGPLCHVSRYGLMTGRYPFRAQVGQWRKNATIASEQVTLPSFLRDQNYATAIVGKWHLGFDEAGYDQPLPGGPVDRGFDSYFGIRASTDIPPYFYIRGDRAVEPPTEQIEANQSDGWSPIQGAFWRAGGIAPNLKLADVLPQFTNEAIQVIRTHRRLSRTAANPQPLFLYLALPAPHTPWLPESRFEGKSKAGMYGDFVMMVDASIGQVLKALDDEQMAEDTLLIFSSDNGPVWYDADVDRFGHDSSGGLRGMKADAWEAGHRMPFIVRWPDVTPAGSTSDELVSFVDLLATTAGILKAPLPSKAGPDSFDFSHVLRGEKRNAPTRNFLAIRSGGGLMTLRQGPWKLIEGLGSGGFSAPRRIKPTPDGPQGQLYHLGDDPAETKNLFQENPELVARLKQQLKRIREAEATRH